MAILISSQLLNNPPTSVGGISDFSQCLFPVRFRAISFVSHFISEDEFESVFGIGELTEAQTQTDETLRNLIAVVDRCFIDDRNDEAQRYVL